MGTANSLSSLIVSLLLLFSCSHLILHCNCRKLNPSSLTPKATAIQYWNLKMGSNKPPPSIFLSKLSTLSPVELINENYNNMRAMMSDEVKEKASTFSIFIYRADDTHNHNQGMTSDKVTEKVATVAIIYQNPEDKSNPGQAMTSDEVKEKVATIPFFYHNPEDKSNPGQAMTSDEIKEKVAPIPIFIYHNPEDKSNPGQAMTSDEDEVKEKVATIPFFYHNPEDKSNPDQAMTSDEIKEKVAPIPIFIYHNPEDKSNPGQAMTSDEIKEKVAPIPIFIYHNPEDKSNPGQAMTSDEDEVKEKVATIPFFYHNPEDQSNPDQAMTSDEIKEKVAPIPIFIYHNPEDKSNPGQAMTSDEVKKKAATFPIFYHSLHHNHMGVASASSTNNKNHHHHMVASGTSDDDAVKVKKEIVLPGTWFRESQLKKGTVMPLLDFRGMMPQQHFLPRSVASTIPFSTAEIKKIFHISEHDTKMAKAVDRTIALCKMPPNPNEIKTCITSAEDMTDFLHSSLGSNKEILVSATENENGSGSEVLFGDIKVVNYNGEVASKVVTCHQLMFPYMLQHCHTIPDTRVYEVMILDAETKKKINQATAICHMDTSTWGATNTAFQVLGSAPGKIEACHWIYPWGTIWTTAAA